MHVNFFPPVCLLPVKTLGSVVGKSGAPAERPMWWRTSSLLCEFFFLRVLDPLEPRKFIFCTPGLCFRGWVFHCQKVTSWLGWFCSVIQVNPAWRWQWKSVLVLTIVIWGAGNHESAKKTFSVRDCLQWQETSCRHWLFPCVCPFS